MRPSLSLSHRTTADCRVMRAVWCCVLPDGCAVETHQDVKPREYAADAKIFSTITECVWASAKGLNTNQVVR